uniref:Zinc finger protein 420-like protein isoform 2 n=1 Tax=Triatoma infestans TaxID=30076 RepID=A0A170TXP1_TRIIF
MKQFGNQLHYILRSFENTCANW